jgi:hypothetical protein
MGHNKHSYYTTLEALLAAMVYPDLDGWDDGKTEWRRRYWTKIWKSWRARHPGAPLVLEYQGWEWELAQDIKHGVYKVSTRQQQKELVRVRRGLDT